MNELDQELKAAFAMRDLANFRWLDEDELKKPFKCSKKGSMTVPLNRETGEEMQAASVFTGHWLTQARQVMKKPRKFRLELRMYQIGSDDYIAAIGEMIKPDTVHALWQPIGEAGDYIMNQNKGADWDENRCVAIVRV